MMERSVRRHRYLPDATHLWQGVQLVASVLLAFVASAALALPEGFWAVMSALIVLRANPGATLSAGRDRVLGTLAGAVCAAGATWLLGSAVRAPAASLAIVAVLAFVSAARPTLRSGPIAALIVLSSSQATTGSAVEVAWLRCAEIFTGVFAGLAVAYIAHRWDAGGRPLASCARLLRELERQLAAATIPGSADAQQAAAQSARAMARRLGELMQGTWDSRQRKLLQLALRVAQDVSLVARLASGGAAAQADPACLDRARAALLAVADHLARQPQAAPREALQVMQDCDSSAWTADSVALLRQDLGLLLRALPHTQADAGK